jgi:hypothetical protein
MFMLAWDRQVCANATRRSLSLLMTHC